MIERSPNGAPARGINALRNKFGAKKQKVNLNNATEMKWIHIFKIKIIFKLNNIVNY